MQWITENWLLLLLGGGMIGMHLFGHGGHGGKGKHGGGGHSCCGGRKAKPQDESETDPATDPAAESTTSPSVIPSTTTNSARPTEQK